ncbi:MAG: hypothetical protein PHI34_13755 [Acidobacteriota bacterium]|nr:hypothetical protein [Acidobacteriota bacterium]
MNKKLVIGGVLAGMLLFLASAGDGMMASIGGSSRIGEAASADDVIGRWTRTGDSLTIDFKKTAEDTYEGRFDNPAGLGGPGVSVGETTITLKYVQTGRYEAQIDRHWKDGRSERRADTFTFEGGRLQASIGDFIRR